MQKKDIDVNVLLKKTIKKLKIKSSPIIITIMGDSILPHDDTIWMSSLIEMSQLLDVDSRAVRTSMYRLTKDNWFAPHKNGRKSYYTLTPISAKRFTTVDTHLYGAPVLTEQNWCRVLLLELREFRFRFNTIVKVTYFANFEITLTFVLDPCMR